MRERGRSFNHEHVTLNAACVVRSRFLEKDVESPDVVHVARACRTRIHSVVCQPFDMPYLIFRLQELQIRAAPFR